MNFKVKKRNGSTENFNIEKINKIINWAVNGYSGVSLTDVEINAKINIYDGVSTKEIHNLLIESAANLISTEKPNYQFVAARLLNYQLRKDVWKGKHAPRLSEFLNQGIKNKVYDGSILENYSEDEINKIGEFIDHERDFTFTYAGIKQLCDKYLIKNRTTGQIHETPQFAYILIATYAFAKYPADSRLNYVRKFYDAISIVGKIILEMIKQCDYFEGIKRL